MLNKKYVFNILKGYKEFNGIKLTNEVFWTFFVAITNNSTDIKFIYNGNVYVIKYAKVITKVRDDKENETIYAVIILED